MKLAILFSGQGEVPTASTTDMWQNHAAARDVWDAAEKIRGESLREWLREGVRGDTRRAQILSVVGSLSTYAAYQSIVGVHPDLVMGHSVGEIAAITVAAGLPLETALELVDARGRAMQNVIDGAQTTGMAAVLNPPADLETRLAEYADVYIANLNSSDQVVISGVSDAIDSFIAAEGLRAIRLDVAGAFHTPLMFDAAAEMRVKVEAMGLRVAAGTTLVSNRTASPFDTTHLGAELAEQIVSPVRWSDSLEWAYAHGVQRVVDLSSTGMFARMSNRPGFQFALGGNESALEETRHELRHLVAVDRSYDLPARALGKIVSTRNENPDPDAYRDVVIPGYQQIRSLVGQSDVDPQTVFEIVDRVLAVKGMADTDRRDVLHTLRWHAGLEVGV